MTFAKNGNKILFILVVISLLSLVVNHQYQVTRAGSLGGTVKGEEWQIEYSLQKESRGEWLIDLTLSAANSKDLDIQKTQVVFDAPVNHDVLTIAPGSNENYRLEGHILSNTKKLSEKEIAEVLSLSYIIINWQDEAGIPFEEKILINDQ